MYGRRALTSSGSSVGSGWAGLGSSFVAKATIVRGTVAPSLMLPPTAGATTTLGSLPSLTQQDKRYQLHHRSSRDEEFVYVAPERVPLMKRLVGGPGRRVLDVGCRFGALTQHYLDGNEVVGIDVDRAALGRAAELGIETVWADAEEPL